MGNQDELLLRSDWIETRELNYIKLGFWAIIVESLKMNLNLKQTEGRETECQGNAVCWATKFNRQSFLKHLTKVLAHDSTQNAHSAGRLLRVLEELMS